jgi:hypothetical protein
VRFDLKEFLQILNLGKYFLSNKKHLQTYKKALAVARRSSLAEIDGSILHEELESTSNYPTTPEEKI